MSKNYGSYFVLKFDNQEYIVENDPMKMYLEPFISSSFLAGESVNWQYYRSSYLVKNGKLYLNSLEGITKQQEKLKLDYLFPGRRRVFLDWYDGVLRIRSETAEDMIFYPAKKMKATAEDGEQFLYFEKGKLQQVVFGSELSIEALDKLRTECHVNYLINTLINRTLT